MGLFYDQNVDNWALKVAQHCTTQTRNPFCNVKLRMQKRGFHRV